MKKTDVLIENNFKNLMKINKKDQDLVTNIVCYLRGQLNSEDAEEAINDVNDILLGAQDRNEDLNEVIGDYKVFCKSIVDEYKNNEKWYNTKSFISDGLSIGIGMVLFFIALDILSCITELKEISLINILKMEYTLSLSPIVSCLMAIIIALVLVRYSFTSFGKDGGLSKVQVGVLFIICFISIVTMALSSMFLRSIKIFTFTNIPAMVILAVLIIIYYFLNTLLKMNKMKKV